MFKIGYNTNGFAHHDLLSAIDIIGVLGYQSVAITIDHHALNPWDAHLDLQLSRVKERLKAYNLSTMIETGARFLLNPRIKHAPTLISSDPSDRQHRIAFIEKCLEIASELESDAVSIWSGIKSERIDNKSARQWLADGCRSICRIAEIKGIPIAFEPEPGMFIETLSQYRQLKEDVNHIMFKLALDAGHAFITEKDVSDSIRAHRDDIANIHLEDMNKDKHDHLFFGEGEMDFQPIFNTLELIQFKGQVNVELSRHSHNAVETARSALAYIKHQLS